MDKEIAIINLFINEYSLKNIKFNKGVSLEIIKDFEQKINFVFPSDFKYFYKNRNGFDYVMDDNLYCLWSIERIFKELSEYYPNQNDIIDFIPIADYQMNSHHVGFLLNKKGLYKDYEVFVKVADTYSEFIQKLLKGDNDLF